MKTNVITEGGKKACIEALENGSYRITYADVPPYLLDDDIALLWRISQNDGYDEPCIVLIDQQGTKMILDQDTHLTQRGWRASPWKHSPDLDLTTCPFFSTLREAMVYFASPSDEVA